MSMPSEDFHSVCTIMDNDYSDSEDNAESIKTSHFSWECSTSSLNCPPTFALSYFTPVPTRTISYETVGVSADLYELPEPVVVEVPVEVHMEVPTPRPKVKEMSIQTNEWKLPAPAIPTVIPAPSPKPGLYHVSLANHQFPHLHLRYPLPMGSLYQL